MVPGLAAMRGAGIEQLLGQGRVGQQKAKCSRAVQCQVEILLMQLNTKARFEVSLHHALAVNFENPRRGEAPHQGLPYESRIGPGFRCKQQRFSHRLNRERDDNLVGDLVVWPSPFPPTRVTFLPIFSNSGFMVLNAFSGPPTMIVSDAAFAPTSPTTQKSAR